MLDFSGRWFTTFGPMELKQSRNEVTGWYHNDCSLEGRIDGGRLRFRYREPQAEGEGWFELPRHGKFQGAWRQDGVDEWGLWIGHREFDGIWDSSFGPMRLVQEPERVFGTYEGLGGASLEGRLEGNRLRFRYREPTAQGEGWFEAAGDCFHFSGEWRPDGATGWAPWVGSRRWPQPGLRWLVVLEAYWQVSLSEKDFAFGTMLKEIFARVQGVEVRHRFFTNEAGLAKWCRDLIYVPEPTVVVLATHATPEGLSAHGEKIGPAVLVENLREADSIRLLHFSSCLLMGDGPGSTFIGALCEQLPFPLSGYATSVDWAASAFIEFMYLDMILARGLAPEAAAEQVTKLLAFAGDEAPADSPYPPAQFRFWQPQDERS